MEHTHSNGKSVRYMTSEGTTWVHCRDLFFILGLKWNSRRVNHCRTKKFRTVDASQKAREQLYLETEGLERLLLRSTREEKVLWIRKMFLLKTSETAPKTEQGVHECQELLQFIHDNIKLPLDLRQRIWTLVPETRPKRRTQLGLETFGDTTLHYLEHENGRCYIELEKVLEILGLPLSFVDNNFHTITYEHVYEVCPDPYEDEIRTVRHIELQHIDTLLKLSKRPAHELQTAIKRIRKKCN